MPKFILEKEGVAKQLEVATLKEAYQKLNINSTTVLATRNNELIIESAILKSKDEIKIIPVISGG